MPGGWNQSINGPVIRNYKQMAVNNKVWLSLGGFQESHDPLECLEDYQVESSRQTDT